MLKAKDVIVQYKPIKEVADAMLKIEEFGFKFIEYKKTKVKYFHFITMANDKDYIKFSFEGNQVRIVRYNPIRNNQQQKSQMFLGSIDDAIKYYENIKNVIEFFSKQKIK